jgi:hypothetical protein
VHAPSPITEAISNPLQTRKEYRSRTILSSFLYRKTRFHPSLFAFGVVRHVRVTHRRQFTGSVCAGVSMVVRTIGDDLGVFVRQ